MKFKIPSVVTMGVIALSTACMNAVADDRLDSIKPIVDKAVAPAMEKYDIPGMAVGITVKGRSYVFDYGVASLDTRKPVTQDTIFEIGSISKTFTATLASYAQVNGQLSLSDKTSKVFPILQGSAFGEVSLLNLGTHTAGSLPLQVPDNIKNNDQLLQYLKQWQSTYAPGTHRTYANPSVGMLGVIAAKSMGQDFASLLDRALFPALGMKRSFIVVPPAQMANYAQGYTAQGKPIRVSSAVLSNEAYGVRTTAADMIRFVQANMNELALDEKLQRAITDTHISYFKADVMTQALIWEQYDYPVELKTLLAGNSSAVIVAGMPVSPIIPPQAARKDVLINKTGATNGFGAYVAFVPQRDLGIVILANKNYPIEERLKIAHAVLTQLDN